jgi:hypothetical protein
MLFCGDVLEILPHTVDHARRGLNWKHLDVPPVVRKIFPKLTDADRQFIRTSDETGLVLAKKFNVSSACISYTRSKGKDKIDNAN